MIDVLPLGRFMYWQAPERIESVSQGFHATGKSTLRKKMVAAHLTTILCEPNTANGHIESHMFCEFRQSTNNIVYARFGLFRTLLCVFTLRIMGKCISRHLFRHGQ